MTTAFLQIIEGTQKGARVALDRSRPLVIGRKSTDLVLDDRLISSTHCRVFYRNGSWVLQDLKSTNGTQVDGRLVREVVLRAGSEIVVGNHRLCLYVDVQSESLVDELDQSDQEHQYAWLLDEELVEREGDGLLAMDAIGQDLRFPPGLEIGLQVISGQDEGRFYRFSRGNIKIGRRQGEVPLTDVEVSREHAVVEVFGLEMIFLRDLGSTNGSYHNGRRVSVAKLRVGDTIGCGKTVMQLKPA